MPVNVGLSNEDIFRQKAKAQGYSDSEINDYLNRRQVATQAATQSQAQPKQKESILEKTDILPILGSIGGAALGSFLAPGIGTIGGGAAGAGLGEALEQQITGKRNLKGLVGETLMGGAGEGIGKGIGVASEAIGKAATRSLPEKLLAGIFKEPLKDTRAAVKTGETLSNTVLKKGAKGLTDESIYSNAVGNINDLEDTLQGILTGSKRTVPVAEIGEAVDPLIKKYAAAGNTSAVNSVTSRLEGLKSFHGKSIPLDIANEVKRTLYDEARGSYGKLASEEVEGTKAIAKALKEGIAKRAPVDSINKELSYQGKIADSLIDKIAKEANKSGLNVVDTLLGAGGYLAAGPVGTLPAVTKVAFGTTPGRKITAQTLKTAGDIAAKTPQLARGVLSSTAGQTLVRTPQLLDIENGTNNANNSANSQESQESQHNLLIPNSAGNSENNTQNQESQESQHMLPDIPQIDGTVKQSSNPYPLENLIYDMQRDPQNAAFYKFVYGEYQKQYADQEPKKKSEAQVAREDISNLIDTAFNQLSGGSVETGLISPRLEEFKATLGLEGDQETIDFDRTLASIKAAIAKARAGTSFTPNEEKLLNQYTPNVGDSMQLIQSKLQGLKNLFSSKSEIGDSQSLPNVDQVQFAQ